MFFHQLILDVPLRRSFTYSHLEALPRGTRVRVRFAAREMCAVIWESDVSPEIPLEKISPILEVFDDGLLCPSNWFDLVAFAARYYHHPIGEVAFSALPTVLRRPKALRPLKGHKNKRHPPSKDISQALHLTAEQQMVFKQISANFLLQPTFSCHVIHGITGSGKTELYLQWIAQVLAQNLNCLVLVPEINLTPQLLDRFTSRFPDIPLAILHSQLSDKQRCDAWRLAHQGTARIVIGTRLAVFTPIPHLGLIIVDEEHDTSFKQQEGLRYHARDLAVWRAKQQAIPLILGSATPSLESMAQVERKAYYYHTLDQRAVSEAFLPTIHLLDMRPLSPRPLFHPLALEAIQGALQRQEMVLVFINRRGYAPSLYCPSCEWMCSCTNCSVRMVFHQSPPLMVCHHCGRKHRPPRQCPSCGHLDMQALGMGTQKIEEALACHFPQARLARVDRDTTQTHKHWDALYEELHQQRIDVLIGTQMLSKGHDFPRVSTVLILDADHSLYSANFRASEWLFAQLLQVSGRAGRGKIAGRVLIQSHHPEHPIYQALSHYDIHGFYDYLLQERKACMLPPFRYFVLIRADASELASALEFLQTIQHILLQYATENIQVHAPIPASLQRLARRERAQLLLESSERSALHHVLHQAIPQIKAPSRIHWSIDVDPLEIT